jgi:DNA-binding NtrC family response regulator
MAHILVVDDHKNTRLTLGIILRNDGHTVEAAETGRGALEKLNRGRFDIVVTDLRLGDIDGIEVLAHIREHSPSTDVVLITAFGSITSAVKAIKLGAYDYISKPLQREKILSLVRGLCERRISRTQEADKGEYILNTAQVIVGENAAMQGILTLAKEIARSDVPVLISGESGTGKELIARFIHHTSGRLEKPFLAINCGALPESLQESELFGYVKGAFTGAAGNKKGIFEEADGGSILLDEIGEMSLNSQVKLLRVLQDGEIRPVGSNRTQHVDIRILAATNQSLASLVKRNRFREDLLFRIAVVHIHLPPLRERLEDLPILTEFFIKKHSNRFQKSVMSISKDALQVLREHSWPGNVRELENCISRAVLLSKGNTIDTRDLEVMLPANVQSGITKLLVEQERELILETLNRTNWNQKRAAQELGIGTTTLWRKIKKFRLSPDSH